MFTVKNGNNEAYRLDSVSVVDTASPLVQLLDNPGFDNTSAVLNGWIEWCDTNKAQLTTSGCQTSSCMLVAGTNNSGFTYILSQTFAAIIGQVYTISFWLKYTDSGGSSTSSVTRVDII